jgi:hypothetical protein
MRLKGHSVFLITRSLAASISSVSETHSNHLITTMGSDSSGDRKTMAKILCGRLSWGMSWKLIASCYKKTRLGSTSTSVLNQHNFFII